MIEIIQHALKGQKHLAQGTALGIMSVSNAPCKGKSFKIHLIKMENPLRYVKLLPLQGALFATHKKPRVLPWAKSFCPFRAGCLYGLLGLRGELLIWAARVALAALFLLFVFIQNNRNESQIAFPFGQRTLFL
nr:hypothetical protein [uncultured Prevotella sp.]